MNAVDFLEALRDQAAKMKVQFMDARYVEHEFMSVRVQDGKAERLTHARGRGVGIRVLADDAWGFASTNRLRSDELKSCLEAARRMAMASKVKVRDPGVVARITPSIGAVTFKVTKDPRSVSLGDKVARLLAYEKAATDFGRDRIVNTLLSYADGYEREVVCNTQGTFVDNEAIRTYLGATITAADGSTRQSGHKHVGGRQGYEIVEATDPKDLSVKAASTAIELLSARRAPSGKFPVILHPTISGLLTHEALGHNVEADAVFAGMSIVEGKMGEKIASDLVNIVDDPTIEKLNGSYAYDSEGTPARRKVVVEKGVLKEFLHSLETAARFGTSPNGSARAGGPDGAPLVRMSNTFILPGQSSLDQMMRETEAGLYLEGGNWGYVMVERGQFTCNVREGWIIRNGEKSDHIRDVSISGATLETLGLIDAVSRETELNLPGTCGKMGQGVPVDGGGPYVRVKELVVGGQE